MKKVCESLLQSRKKEDLAVVMLFVLLERWWNGEKEGCESSSKAAP